MSRGADIAGKSILTQGQFVTQLDGLYSASTLLIGF